MFAFSINWFAARLSVLVPLALTMVLGCNPPDEATVADPEADIVRDEWGVPHIFSEDERTITKMLEQAAEIFLAPQYTTGSQPS